MSAARADCVPLTPEWEASLLAMLRALEASGDSERFQPHPFDAATVARLACHAGKDVYCVLLRGGRVEGYGMLRGWDEGYEIPSLGIAIHPAARNLGLGRELMRHLHATAATLGAVRVRLRVLETNAAAVALYRSLGYEFGPHEGNYMVGFLALPERN